MIKELAAAEEEKAKVVRKVIFFFVGGGTTLCSDRSYSLSSVSSRSTSLQGSSLPCLIVRLPLCNKIKAVSLTAVLFSRESLSSVHLKSN